MSFKGIDYSKLEKMLLDKNLVPEGGIYQKIADECGVTRREAKLAAYIYFYKPRSVVNNWGKGARE